ncbi:MAG: alpha-hydroxy acid oxidase [Phycisphaerales bacterium]
MQDRELRPAPDAQAIERMLNVFEFEEAAGAALDRLAWDYYRSGAWGETTVRANRDAWDRLRIWHRALVDVSKRDAATRVLGVTWPFPLILAPTALHRLAHPEGEVATARGASSLDCPMILSSLSSVAIEDVCAATKACVWMQVYLSKDRDFTLSLLYRARKAGCSAIVLTVDTPVWGVRERDIRNGWRMPPGIDVVNLVRPGHSGSGDATGGGIGAVLGWTIDAAITWRDLTWMIDRAQLPVIVKGLCRGDDALRALDAGARGVIVSNHGGRQLDGAPPTAESLPDVVRAIGGRVPIIVDGGVRRGTDILRALALGANAVAIGRPVLWGLAVGGDVGVARVLAILRGEFDVAMALAGCRNVGEITSDLLRM